MDGGSNEKEKWGSCILCCFGGNVFIIGSDFDGVVCVDDEPQSRSKLDQRRCDCRLCIVVPGGRVSYGKVYGKVQIPVGNPGGKLLFWRPGAGWKTDISERGRADTVDQQLFYLYGCRDAWRDACSIIVILI